jgi:IPT/TIG domain
MSADGYQFTYNTSAVFPVSSGATLESLDPVTYTILRFFENVLQLNLGQAFAADCASCGLTNQNINNFVDGYMVGMAISFPPKTILQTTDVKFPLFSVCRTNRKFTQHSTMKMFIESDYSVYYTLPPLSPNQYNKLYKYFSAISDALIFRTWKGSDPNYNNGELVWKTAGIEYGLCHKDEIGVLEGIEGKTEFPTLKLSFSFFEEGTSSPDNYEPLTGFDIETDCYDGYNVTTPYLNIADAAVNPNLTISSINVSSGSIAGNTIVIITGAGFDNMVNNSTITEAAITFNNAPVSKFIVKTNNIILAITGPGSAGVGDVVVTDNLGNIATLQNCWTYF